MPWTALTVPTEVTKIMNTLIYILELCESAVNNVLRLVKFTT